MIRELLIILSCTAFIVIGTDYYHVNPFWLLLAVVALWMTGHGLDVSYTIWSTKRKEKAKHEAWLARRAEGLRKLEEAAQRAARQANRVRGR
jgi:hypothetical protein